MISPTELTLFKGSNTAIPGREENALIPNIDSVIRLSGIVGKNKGKHRRAKKKKRHFSLILIVSNIFMGTLHVIGLQGPTNVYHTISDNYIPYDLSDLHGCLHAVAPISRSLEWL
jgi:hypothetical protein